MFEARTAETPDAVALVFENEALTFRELNRRANRVAHQLRELNVGPDVMVGICVERSIEMVVDLLGILKAGGAYVPLDPSFPKERLEQMITDAQMPVLLTQENLAPQLPTSSAKVVLVQPGADAPGFDENVSSPVSSENLAYVIYTSGSTGKPKAVQVLHRAVMNLLTSAARTAGVTAIDNLLAVTTISFDIAALELYLPLILGGKLTLASREAAADGTQLAALIESSGATLMQATPATWRLLIEAGWQGSKNLKIFCGGEALKPGLADDLLKRAKEVWNFYGPTETTIWSTAWKVAPGEAISIGRPLANMQVYILGPHLQPLPVGAIGELHIGGDGLARGYLNRPELTAEKFIRNPFSNDANSRLYKTGDLARYLPDGRIECLSRIDHQVKIHGFRIELGDVETVLRRHSGIADALVTAREDALGEQRLVG